LRIKIECPIRKAVTLPINYNYYLTGVIYNFLRQSDQNYASFLHQEGYRNQQKRFKLFTFSQLQARRRQIKGDQICFQSTVSWYISSPKDEFLTHLAGSLLAQQQIQLGNQELEVSSVSAVKDPDYSSSMKFKCLAPLTMSTKREWQGKNSTYYCLPQDEEISALIQQNLERKYQAIHQLPLTEAKLKVTFDADYIQRRQGKVTRLVQFKDQSIRGIMCPFQAEGSVELIELGYQTGFGDKNSFGFGMVEVIESKLVSQSQVTPTKADQK